MSNDKLTLTLELHLGEGLTGGVRPATGPGRRFSGWLGLLGAIDGLVAEADGTAGERQPLDPAHPEPDRRSHSPDRPVSYETGSSNLSARRPNASDPTKEQG